MEGKNKMIGAFGAELTSSIKSLILDAIGDATGNDFEMISSVIHEEKTEELDKIVGKIENVFLDYTTEDMNLDTCCYAISRAELNIFIRHILNEQVDHYERYEKSVRKGEKYRQIEEAENNLRILKGLVDQYEGACTEWQEIVFGIIRDSGNKTLLLFAGWLFV